MPTTDRREQERILAPVFHRGDWLMLGMLLLHMAAGVCFATFYDTWLETWTIGGLAVGAFVVAIVLQPGAFVTRCVAGICLQAFVALHIYQLHGLAEMHFFFFTAFAAMIAYQDWRCMWPGAALIIAQHVLFAVMHNQGVNVYFYEGDYVGITKLGFHFGIALFHVLLCNLWATLLRRQTLIDDRIHRDLEKAQATAERTSAAKTEFLGNMSHELRTPMAGVLGMAELMLQQDLSAEQRENLEVVRNSAKAIVDIVNDALDLTRVEAGKLELSNAPFDLRRLAEEVVELLQTRAEQHGVELVTRWAPSGPSMLVGDQGRLRQLLINLTGNAIKFAAGGYVLLDISVANAAPGERAAVVIRVEDNGKGIAADVMPRLFQRFEQGGAATFGTHGGSGLGLAICRELAQLMHGHITVHSVLGAGATFVFQLMLPVAAAAAPPPRVDLRALLIGSRELTLAVMAEQLETMGAEVTVALDSTSAKELVRAAAKRGTPFQLLFTAPEALSDLDGIEKDLRIVLLGRDHQEAPGERIVWLSRHRELQRMVESLGETAPTARPGRTPRAGLPNLGLRVLLVEDDAVCATVAARMLEVLGCKVTRAENGEEALQHFRAAGFDAILMDCRMPVMDGYRATEAIRSLEQPGERIPILSLSANSLPEDRAACFRSGADLFLTKPVNLAALAEALVSAAPMARGRSLQTSGDSGPK